MADHAKPTIDLVLATKAILERDLQLGLVTEQQLRYTVEARKQVAKALADAGASTREIAKVVGASQSTVVNDLSEQKRSETEQNYSPNIEKPKENPRPLVAPPPMRGSFSTVVIDPPWPMEKIERDVRPNQVGFDYPTMSEDELINFPLEEIMATDCHVFQWTTHKFLPLALKLFKIWGVRYVLTMVWHKPGGYQPVGLPQYNCEFVIYGRRGTPGFVDTKAFNCCFEAPRREHSRKPDEFYDLVRRVTAGPRTDIFSREPRDGFEQWGNEIGKFAA